MKNKLFPFILILVGILLTAVSAGLLISDHIQRNAMAADIPGIVKKIEAALPERSAGIIEKRADNTMPSVEIDKTDFIGLLALPERNITLPVGAVWDSSGRGFRPAKFLGSVYDGSLIIGGAFQTGNFDFADKLEVGEKITFTDMTGRVFRYTVGRISHSDNAKAETLRDSDYELTLFVKKENAFLILRCNAA